MNLYRPCSSEFGYHTGRGFSVRYYTWETMACAQRIRLADLSYLIVTFAHDYIDYVGDLIIECLIEVV